MTSTEAARAGSPKLVPCPTCGGDSLYAPSNDYRPFCSNRCKNIDLGAWANEDFRMAAKVSPEDLLTNDEQ
ncbi:MAG: DNA gyrase inhibitor YacG [Rhodoferax sp.]|uniref:DNA gyrase inhibitor YacG n=1 Tax=Rhodoferax sp. TaxID=50421 RepID=UPI00301799BA